MKRLLLCISLLCAPLWAHADLAADIAASTGSVTITALATQVDAPVVFLYVKGSDLPPDFWTALDTASDTDFHTVFATTGDGSTRLPMWVTLPNTSTDTAGIWIRALETMSASVDVDTILWAGNAAMSTPGATDPYGRDAVFGGTGGYVGGYMPGLLPDDITGGARTLTTNHGTATSAYEGITTATYNGAQYDSHTGTPAITTAPWTLESVAYAGNTTHNGHTIGIGNTSSTDNFGYLMFRGSSGAGDRVAVHLVGNGGSQSIAETATSFSATTWTYLAATRSGTGNAGTSTAYIDAANSGTNATTTSTISGANTTSIGAKVDGVPDTYLNGGVAVSLMSASVRSADFLGTNKRNFDGALYSAGAWVSADTGMTVQQRTRGFFN